METRKAFEYAVVLAPAIAVSLLMLSLTVTPGVIRWMAKSYSDRHAVELAKEMIVHAAFYGVAAASLLGYKSGPYSLVVAGLWFALAARIAYGLALRIKHLEIGEHDA